MNKFARRLKEARKEAHLTQDELANRLNVSKSTISMWENGNRIPSINITIPLSRVLNKPPSFFTGDSVRINKDGSAGLGIESRGFHVYRATFCTNLCRAGVPLEVASKLMGHKSLEVTAAHYALIHKETKREAIEKLKL